MSCYRNHFKAALDYHAAVESSSFDETIMHIPSQLRERQKQISWFNLPLSVTVKVNFGKIFIRLVYKHFPCYVIMIYSITTM